MQAVVEVTSLSRKTLYQQGAFRTEVESFIIQSGVVYDVDFTVNGLRESHEFKHINSGRNLLNRVNSSLLG